MWFKIMGSILAVTGAAGVGVMAAGVYARRLKMLLLWQQILQRLYGSMEYYAADMEDIFHTGWDTGSVTVYMKHLTSMGIIKGIWSLEWHFPWNLEFIFRERAAFGSRIL